METAPRPVNSGPPSAVVAAVGWLIPRPHREVALGDLLEAYRSPREFARDAAAWVACAFWTELRRTFRWRVLAFEAAALLVSFSSAPFSFELGVALAAGLAALTLRDAYGPPRRGALLDAPADAAATLTFAILAAAALKALLTPEVLRRAALLTLATIFVTRAVFAHAGARRLLSCGQVRAVGLLWVAAALLFLTWRPAPAMLPYQDFLFVALPIALFGAALRLGRNPLEAAGDGNGLPARPGAGPGSWMHPAGTLEAAAFTAAALPAAAAAFLSEADRAAFAWNASMLFILSATWIGLRRARVAPGGRRA